MLDEDWTRVRHSTDAARTTDLKSRGGVIKGFCDCVGPWMPGLLGGHVLILAKFFVQRQKHVHCSVKQSWLPVLLPVACSEIIGATGYLQKRTGRKWLGNTERGAGLGQDGPVLTVHDTTGYGVLHFVGDRRPHARPHTHTCWRSGLKARNDCPDVCTQ